MLFIIPVVFWDHHGAVTEYHIGKYLWVFKMTVREDTWFLAQFRSLCKRSAQRGIYVLRINTFFLWFGMTSLFFFWEILADALGSRPPTLQYLSQFVDIVPFDTILCYLRKWWDVKRVSYNIYRVVFPSVIIQQYLESASVTQEPLECKVIRSMDCRIYAKHCHSL